MKTMTLGEAREHAIRVLEEAEQRRIEAAAAEYKSNALALAWEVADYIRSHPITDWNAWAERLAADGCTPGALGGS